MRILDAFTKAIAKMRRKTLANRIFELHSGVVQDGPFKGLNLDGDSNVSRGPLALKVFGLYEHEVVNEIVQAAPFGDLVNLGAADGYMSLGPIFGDLCQRSICFEMTETGRAAVQKNAHLNDISDRTRIRGTADETLLDQLNEENVDFSNSVILCDIEGAEFSVLTADFLETAKAAKIIVELHDRLMPEGFALREELIARIPKECTYRITKADSVPFAGIDELERMHDLDRSLVLSEGRKVIGEWLVIEPK